MRRYGPKKLTREYGMTADLMKRVYSGRVTVDDYMKAGYTRAEAERLVASVRAEQ